MMTDNGYFTVARQIKKSWIYPHNRKFTEFEAWLWLIQNVYYFCNEKMVNGKIMIIPRGYLDITVEQLSFTWKWNRRTVDKFLQLLVSEMMIKCFKINPKSRKSCTLIKVNNYNAFQPNISGHCTSKYKLKCKLNCTLEYKLKCTPYNKEIKDIKKEERKKDILPHQNVSAQNTKLEEGYVLLQGGKIHSDFEPAITIWLEYKKEKGQKYKHPKSIEALYNKLLKLSGQSPQKAMEIIEESMANNWSGFFKQKEEPRSQGGRI